MNSYFDIVISESYKINLRLFKHLQKAFCKLGEEIFSTINSNIYLYFSLETKMLHDLDFADYMMLPKH